MKQIVLECRKGRSSDGDIIKVVRNAAHVGDQGTTCDMGFNHRDEEEPEE